MRQRLFVPAGCREQFREASVSRRAIGLDQERLPTGFDRLVGSLGLLEGVGEIDPCIDMAGTNADGLGEQPDRMFRVAARQRAGAAKIQGLGIVRPRTQGAGDEVGGFGQAPGPQGFPARVDRQIAVRLSRRVQAGMVHGHVHFFAESGGPLKVPGKKNRRRRAPPAETL